MAYARCYSYIIKTDHELYLWFLLLSGREDGGEWTAHPNVCNFLKSLVMLAHPDKNYHHPSNFRPLRPHRLYSRTLFIFSFQH